MAGVICSGFFFCEKVKSFYCTFMHARQYTLRRVSVTTVAVQKQKNITYSEPVLVVLGIQHVMRMRHIVVCDFSGFKIFFPLYFIFLSDFNEN
jgi:hypothetical protein